MAPPRDIEHPPAPPAEAAARASASVTVLGIDHLVAALRVAQPPAPYRLSLDSGIEYRNVRRALEQPRAARFDTWLRLLGSLQIRLVAARRIEDVIWPAAGTALVALGPGAGALAAPACCCSLEQFRSQLGVSRRRLARRAGMCADAVTAVEQGRGLVRSVLRLCQALGLQVVLVLPPQHGSFESLWQERADALLRGPVRVPRGAPASRRPTRLPGAANG